MSSPEHHFSYSYMAFPYNPMSPVGQDGRYLIVSPTSPGYKLYSTTDSSWQPPPSAVPRSMYTGVPAAPTQQPASRPGLLPAPEILPDTSRPPRHASTARPRRSAATSKPMNQPRDMSYKTSICRHYLRTGGWCPMGDNCNYIHDPNFLAIDRESRSQASASSASPSTAYDGSRVVGGGVRTSAQRSHCWAFVQGHCRFNDCQYFHPPDLRPYIPYTPCLKYPNCPRSRGFTCDYRHPDDNAASAAPSPATPAPPAPPAPSAPSHQPTIRLTPVEPLALSPLSTPYYPGNLLRAPPTPAWPLQQAQTILPVHPFYGYSARPYDASSLAPPMTPVRVRAPSAFETSSSYGSVSSGGSSMAPSAPVFRAPPTSPSENFQSSATANASSGFADFRFPAAHLTAHVTPNTPFHTPSPRHAPEASIAMGNSPSARRFLDITTASPAPSLENAALSDAGDDDGHEHDKEHGARPLPSRAQTRPNSRPSLEDPPRRRRSISESPIYRPPDAKRGHARRVSVTLLK